MKTAWLVAVAIAIAASLPSRAAACVAPECDDDRSPRVEIVVHVPLGVTHPIRDALLAFADPRPDVPGVRTLRDLPRLRPPRLVTDTIATAHRMARLTRVLVRVTLTVLEHLTADDRAPRPR